MTTTSQNILEICPVGRLGHGECLEFVLAESITDKLSSSAHSTVDAFVINWHDAYLAYLNSCPHTGINLNWSPNQFLDVDSQFLQCSTHGAIFEPKTGTCLRGPCQSESLVKLPTKIVNDIVCIDLRALQ